MAPWLRMMQCPLLLASFVKFKSSELPSREIKSCTKHLNVPISQFVGLDLRQPEVADDHKHSNLDNVVQFLPKINSILIDSNARPVVVTWRGILARIMTKEPLTLLACKYNNVLYVMEDPDESRKLPFHPAEVWGQNFEQKVVQVAGEMNDHEFGCVFKTRINGTKIVYGAEVDCVDENGRFVELKTSRSLETKRQQDTFWTTKVPKYWAQCYLVGIDRLLVGFRSDSGIVQSLKWLQTSELQKRVPHKEMFQRLGSFLDELLVTVDEEGPLVYWKISVKKDFEFAKTYFSDPTTNHIVPWHVVQR